jgi:hypothetical protein
MPPGAIISGDLHAALSDIARQTLTMHQQLSSGTAESAWEECGFYLTERATWAVRLRQPDTHEVLTVEINLMVPPSSGFPVIIWFG